MSPVCAFSFQALFLDRLRERATNAFEWNLTSQQKFRNFRTYVRELRVVPTRIIDRTRTATDTFSYKCNCPIKNRVMMWCAGLARLVVSPLLFESYGSNSSKLKKVMFGFQGERKIYVLLSVRSSYREENAPFIHRNSHQKGSLIHMPTNTERNVAAWV